MKILALQFKYFGDAVLMTPALRALREHFPTAELHLLVPEEIAPLFHHLPLLTKVWPMPRRRGRASFGRSWPVIRALRREQFDRSVNFASNDRGALIGWLIGARQRLGWDEPGGFWGRRHCYTQRVKPGQLEQPESIRLAQLLSGWQVPPPTSFAPEIRVDPACVGPAETILPDKSSIVCHIASSRQKKEWPLSHWSELHRLATAAGHHLVFTTARGEREQSLMAGLKKLAPGAEILPLIPELPLFVAVLQRAALFIAGDTGPLHFAAALGVPTISLFGPSPARRWAPLGEKHQVLTGGACSCEGRFPDCRAIKHCLADIAPEQLFDAIQKVAGSR